MTARRMIVIAAAIAVIAGTLVPIAAALDQVTVPTSAGQTVTVTWQGTALPGANPGSDCSGTALGADNHEVALVVPSGTYSQVSVLATAQVTYAGPADLIITIIRPDGSSVSADDGSFGTAEAVSISNPATGTYRIVVCPFLGAAPQAYAGTLTLTAAATPPPISACRAPGKPIVFSQPMYVDTARAGGEPSVVAHPDGTLLYAAHAGTTHFFSLEADDPDSEAFFENYRGQVHAWYSTDNGASWQFVDRSLPPENLPNSGFSDPDFAIDAAGNVYLSEINLVNVAVSKSTTSGKSYGLQNFFAEDITDRQWSAAGPAGVLFLDGNPSEGGTAPNDPVGHDEHTIYRSMDGGKTFSDGVSDPGGLGDIIYDPVRSTLYEANYDGTTLSIAAFRQALTANAATALTPELSTIATGVSELSHWPAIDVDARGNLYIAWDESGNGARAAGIWSSYSTDAGHTWAKAFRVDPDDRTDIWPWIAVGDQGRVAISWFGNDHALPDNDAEAAGPTDPWNVYVAQTTSGLGCDGSNVPGYKVSKATPVPFHVGTICMGGTTCQAMLIDRRLGDYFTIDIDTTGAVVLAYSDTRQGGAVSLPAFQRQTGGTSFLKGPPRK
ncbi:MAG TPA: sialidase family protein [Patescibacteria group bacterium]|nr:sialidase family protein [Patescibacteria group bacterium]